MEIKVEAKVWPDRIELKEIFKDSHFDSRIIQDKCTQVLNLKEKTITDALVSLGWTPPAGSKTLIEALDHIANPLKAMQAEAKENDYELDTRMALRLSACDLYLKGLARSALITHQSELGSSLEVQMANASLNDASASLNAVMRDFVDVGDGKFSYKRPKPYESYDIGDDKLTALRDELQAALKANEELKAFVRHFLSVQNRWKPSLQGRGIKAYRVAEIVFYQAKQLLDKLNHTQGAQK
ncbi:hypothetical protein [Vibrio sp. TBV020]|uniref:hypothetical protein n=1 Tax=Vibrio sp. TBV020 TaxID=3137398 RepID=UPI0038CD2AA0